jgi:hypothetical protein
MHVRECITDTVFLLIQRNTFRVFYTVARARYERAILDSNLKKNTLEKKRGGSVKVSKNNHDQSKLDLKLLTIFDWPSRFSFVILRYFNFSFSIPSFITFRSRVFGSYVDLFVTSRE